MPNVPRASRRSGYSEGDRAVKHVQACVVGICDNCTSSPPPPRPSGTKFLVRALQRLGCRVGFVRSEPEQEHYPKSSLASCPLVAKLYLDEREHKKPKSTSSSYLRFGLHTVQPQIGDVLDDLLLDFDALPYDRKPALVPPGVILERYTDKRHVAK